MIRTARLIALTALALAGAVGTGTASGRGYRFLYPLATAPPTPVGVKASVVGSVPKSNKGGCADALPRDLELHRFE